jgi:uncharacterized protein RhaS with RHS repeats
VGHKIHLNLYTYVDNDPLNKTDPTGETCTQGDNKAYTCQVDSMTDAKGNVTQRADFSEKQVKQVAAFEKSYTKAVNELANHPDRMVALNVPGDKSQNIPAAGVAQKLAATDVRAVPTVAASKGFDGSKASMYASDAFHVTVFGSGLRGAPGYGENARVLGSPDLMRQVGIVHESLHWTRADRTSNLPDFGSRHQVPFNQTAEQLLGLE